MKNKRQKNKFFSYNFSKKNRKGYFFSLDALIALLVILGVVLFIKPPTTQITSEVNLQKDLLVVLSSLKIGEIDNQYVSELISNGTITNLNQTILEQIGEFYANSRDEAGSLSSEILNDLDLKENIGIYFNDMLIASSANLTFNNATKIWTSRQTISGIDNNINSSSRGFSSRAFLFAENKVDYFYFGGYVGDGNLSVNLGENVVSAKVEAAFSRDFDLSVNNNPPTNHSPTPGVPFEFTISNGFVSGQNYLYFNSTGSNLYIAGGFVKIVYNDSATPQPTYRHNFPGIEGFVNLYDSFYVPGPLNELEVFLHYNSSYNVFLTIGNQTVYSGNGTDVQETLDNTTLATTLDFPSLSNKTIPFRFGIENISYILNLRKDADVYSVTDLSGSMQADCNGGGFWCCIFNEDCSTEAGCTACGGILEDKIQLAKDANKVFIDEVLEDENNRVGVIGYSSSVDQNDNHALSTNKISLKAKVDEWDAGGTTCICCGINEGVTRLVAESTEEDFRSLVVMSDGEANVDCNEQNTGDPKQDAIQAACDAAALGIKVYSVAFGSGADITTLEAIASCGEGGFYFGNLEDLIQIYQDIAQEILNAAYYEQTVIGEGFHTSLYSDSYISVSYDKEIPYGLIVTTESEEFGSNAPLGRFTIPDDTTPYEAKVVSYSGSKWTSKVDVSQNSSWETIFDLSNYQTDYVNLGDPYVVNIPLDKINTGNNTINVTLGVGSSNTSAGSEYNKIIYSVLKNISGFSPIVSSAEGCIWTIEFEDNTNSTMSFPTNYSGSDTCSYTSSEIIFNNNDAIDYAIFNLLSSLDLNSNGKIETRFEEQDLTINSIEVEGIPFVWETEAQVRVWR